MNRPRAIEQIEAILGRTFTTVETIGEYSAFRAPLDEPRIILTADSSEFPLYRMIDTVGEHGLRCYGLGYTVFIGMADDAGSPSLYAIADADSIRLMAIFDVGNHNDFTGDTPARAQRYMAALLETDPFVPYYMDAAGYKVRFINPVTEARAGEIARAVLEFDPDASSLAEAPTEDALAAADIGPVDALARAIHEKQRLELWWD